MTAMRWGRRIATGVVLVGLVAIGLGRGVGAQTGPAFSAQIQLALRALLAGDQTITGDWTCTGTCTGFGGGGGGTPASPDTSVQFNNGGSFGGSANLTWDGSILAVGTGHTPITPDTATAFAATATTGNYGLAIINPDYNPAPGAYWAWGIAADGTLLVDSPTHGRAQAYGLDGSIFLGGIAEPDLSCCDGPTSNGFTSIANGYIQNNYVAAGDGLGYTNLTFYASQGTVASPTTQIAGAGIWGFDYYAYGASSYEYRGSLYAQTDALDATHTESQWAAFGTASGSASVKLNSRTGMVTVGGDLTVNGLAGAGNLPACIDSTGKLYKGSNTAGVLSCP